MSMHLASPSFVDNQTIPPRFTCDGENMSPALIISGTPPEAKSLTLIVDDPDSPSGTWVHWSLWNISPETKELEEGLVPPGAVEGITDFGDSGYGGPCPASGAHRYFFKIYALDTLLDLPLTASAGEIMEAMKGHILDEAHLVGIYLRNTSPQEK